jgi:fatty acid/phospholipid biosynthesis enzyme
MASVPRIGIDAMGGDHGPDVVAEGVALAFREMPDRFSVTLVGIESEIRAALKRHKVESPAVQIVHAEEQIDMAEKAASAVRRKSGSSLGVLTQLHKDGQLDAIFSAGNTGAFVATALLGLGRLEGVSRPALAAIFPGMGGGTSCSTSARTPSAARATSSSSRTWARCTHATCSAARIPAWGCSRSAKRTPRATASCSRRCP